jgi:hypothetical protein
MSTGYVLALAGECRLVSTSRSRNEYLAVWRPVGLDGRDRLADNILGIWRGVECKNRHRQQTSANVHQPSIY